MRILAWIASGLALVTVMRAQNALPLTLAEAQRMAIQNNPQLSAARLTAEAAAQAPPRSARLSSPLFSEV